MPLNHNGAGTGAKATFMRYSMLCPYAKTMVSMVPKSLRSSASLGFAALALVGGIAIPAEARRSPDQQEVFDQRRAGAIRPLHEIEGRVVPRMGGASYLGPEFDSRSATYRLKFMRSGSVIWVDVDGRTGAIIGRSGN